MGRCTWHACLCVVACQLQQCVRKITKCERERVGILRTKEVKGEREFIGELRAAFRGRAVCMWLHTRDMVWLQDVRKIFWFMNELQDVVLEQVAQVLLTYYTLHLEFVHCNRPGRLIRRLYVLSDWKADCKSLRQHRTERHCIAWQARCVLVATGWIAPGAKCMPVRWRADPGGCPISADLRQCVYLLCVFVFFRFTGWWHGSCERPCMRTHDLELCCIGDAASIPTSD